MASDVQNTMIFTNSGMDQDTDIIAIKAGDSKYRLNVTLTEDTNFEILCNMKGNTLRSYSLPAGTNIVKGFVEDKEHKAGIHFIWNSNNNHCIVRFNSEDNSFTNILVNQAAILPSWGSWTGYVSAEIIGNEDDQYLIWCDGRAPKMINTTLAIAGGFYNSTITAEEISFYKAPLLPGDGNYNITATYGTSLTFNQNKIAGKIFQIAIRLLYYDNTFSVLSNYSEIAVPQDNMVTGRVVNDQSVNQITFTFNIQNEPTIIKKYQLLYRIVDIGGGSPGNWYIYDEYDYTSKGDKSVIFLNEKSIGTVAESEALRPYDYVPDKTNYVGVIDSNRAVFDVGQEGYDNIDIDVSIATQENSIAPNVQGLRVNSGTNIITSSSYTFSLSMNEDDDYFILVDIAIATDTYHGIYNFSISNIDTANFIIDFYNGTALTNLTYTNLSSANTFSIRFTEISGIGTIVKVLVFGSSPYFRTLKTGASYKFGIEYGFNGKRGSVQTSDDLILEVPDFKDISSTYGNYYLNALLTINHLPPSGATDYRIVSYGNNISYYEQYLVAYNYSDITASDPYYTIYLEEPYTVIKRDDMLNRMRLAYGDETYGIEYGFDMIPGDTIKFIGKFANYLISDIRFDVALQDVKEYKIEVVTDTEIKISSSAIKEIFSLSSSSADSFWLIEIIHKKETFDAIAQEFSPSFPIVNGYHLAYSQDQTASVPAIVNITNFFADCWKSKQPFITPTSSATYIFGESFYVFAFMEKPRISLYYDSYPTSQGRQNAVNPNAMQVSDNKIVWGGQWLDESGVNFLTKFDGDSYRNLDDRNGTITKIIQIGDVLRVYQERKVTSFYLKTTSSTNADGSATYVFSSEVMSDGRQFIDDFGCTHFSSYVKNVRNGYFFDLVNSAVLRDSANGLQPISDYGMHVYFKEISRSIQAYSGNGTIEVLGGWDEDLGVYLISFVNIYNGVIQTNALNATLAFQEDTNKWVSFYSFIPEFYGKISGDQLLSFKGGSLYEHNINETRNNYYGVQYYSEVWIHANEQPLMVKVFDAIEINSVNQWYCPNNDSIEITRPIQMQSRLVAGKFRIQEGIYRADFLRDALNGGSWSRVNLLNGRQLRGKEMTVKLRNTNTTKSLLETVIINGSLSK